MKKPIILMTFGTDTGGVHAIPRLTIYRNYADSLNALGAHVLGITDPDETAARELCEAADGLLLTGGVDVSPAYYGEEPMPECGNRDAWRDEMELAYAKAFLAAKKPIMGICRGMQLINVALGGTLYQDIPTQLGYEHPHAAHEVVAREGSELSRLFGRRFTVNSYHHQAVKKLGEGLIADAVFAEDERLVEAVHHETLPVAAYQWHPERMCGKDRMTQEGPDMEPLFRRFLEAAKR